MDLHWHSHLVTKTARSALKRQRPACVWFTGLSASGKSTLANMVELRLHEMGLHTFVLDGDNIRQGLNRDLGFEDHDRAENIRRVSEVARLMVDAGLIVLVSFISPFKSDRALARSLFSENEFFEVFVDAPLEVCLKRDPKGLYAKAANGHLKNFTGFDSGYEKPTKPEIHIDTTCCNPSEGTELILNHIHGHIALK